VILSDRTIREQIAAGRIVIDPLDESLIQPSSIDVRISNLYRVFRNHTRGVIDVKEDTTDLTELVEIPEDGSQPFMLHPGEFVLGSTLERIAVPDDLVARIEGKSSLGRLGLLIHSTAGFIDAGFDGHVTLELANVASLPITLYPGMKIGQVSFMQMTTPADRPYGRVRPARSTRASAAPPRAATSRTSGSEHRMFVRAVVPWCGGPPGSVRSRGGRLWCDHLRCGRSASRRRARRGARAPARPW
jgi:dCTP deaminase